MSEEREYDPLYGAVEGDDCVAFRYFPVDESDPPRAYLRHGENPEHVMVINFHDLNGNDVVAWHRSLVARHGLTYCDIRAAV